MGFLDVQVRIQHPCPFCEFSSAFPDAVMAQWCNLQSEVLQISVPAPGRLGEVLEAARERLEAKDLFEDGRSALTMSRRCLCGTYPSITSFAQANGLWQIPPISYQGGWETHRLVATSRTGLSRFVSDVRHLGRIEIVSLRSRERLDGLRDLGVVPVHFFSGLTERQIRALVAAYENGLFEIPAPTRMVAVARRQGLSRSTFGEHLRKAQLQLLRNSYPYLKLGGEPRLETGPRARRPSAVGARRPTSAEPERRRTASGK